MAYFCKDCSHRSTATGQAGECQACGSFNLSMGQIKEDKKPPAGKSRLMILVVLWAYLVGMIIWKMNH